jgi:Ca2+-binding RTX toxin-like protein
MRARVVLAIALGILGAGAASPAAGGAALRCNLRVASLSGTTGDDVIRATPGPDVVHARGGDDQVWGLGGNDEVCGGRGDDRIYGGRSDDSVHGGRGRDRVHGGRGGDFVDIADLVGGNDFGTGGRGEDHCALDAYRPSDVIDECEGESSGVIYTSRK